MATGKGKKTARKTPDGKAPRKQLKKPDQITEEPSEDQLPLTAKAQAKWDYSQKAIEAGKAFMNKKTEAQMKELYKQNGYWQPGDSTEETFKKDGKLISDIKRDKVRRDLHHKAPRNCLKCAVPLKDAEDEYSAY